METPSCENEAQTTGSYLLSNATWRTLRRTRRTHGAASSPRSDAITSSRLMTGHYVAASGCCGGWISQQLMSQQLMSQQLMSQQLMSQQLVRGSVQPRRLELIARQPVHRALRQHRLPTQGKAEFRNRCITGEIHVRRKFVAGTMVTLRRVFFVLRFSPLRRMTRKFHAGVDGERRHTGTRHAEVIGPVVVSGTGFCIRLNLKSKDGGRLFNGGVERGSLSARDVDGLRHADG